ncbi:discoidin domain-containing protein [Cohnella silvisoli]|uniref:Discoidin domain-containing protein n=1 Tax=Cohnella silvisoli TaxID=2873699 RepID=A0ABV1KMV9_9BACL|nr:discoidin domain-containing protein [Cohnella silvisoli]MCD9020269.1 discoidin domain-containing protein [Cohnella silvisoli]
MYSLLVRTCKLVWAVLLLFGSFQYFSAPPRVSAAVLPAAAAAASTALGGYPASNAIDGSIPTMWSSLSHASETATEWISFDLGTAQTVDTLRVQPRDFGYGFPADFKLQVSGDAVNWIDIPGQTYTGYANPGLVQQRFDFAPIKTRYVRMYATKLRADNSGTNYYFQLHEAWVERNAPVSAAASSQLTGYEAAKGADHLFNNFWSSAGYADANHTEWFAEDLGIVRPVERVVLYPRDSGYGFPSDFKLQTSLDGTTWTDIPGQSYANYANPGATPQEFKFQTVLAKSVRVYATKLNPDNAGTYYLQLLEMVVVPTVTASSDSAGAGYGLAEDGSETTVWSSAAHSAQTSTEWILIDYGQSAVIDKLKAVPNPNGKGFPVDFKLQYSSDGSAWTDIPGQSHTNYPAPGAAAQAFSFDPVDARYFRLFATKLGADAGGSFSLQLAEMSGEQTHRRISLVRYGGDASTAAADRSYKSMYDGDAATYWSSASHARSAFTEYAAIQFGQSYDVHTFKATPKTGGYGFPVDFKLQYSTDFGTNWTDIPGQSYANYANPGSAQQTFTFAPITANAIRMLATKLGADQDGSYCFALGEASAEGNHTEQIKSMDASGSSFLAGWEPKLAADLKADSVYSSQAHASSAFTEWLATDFGMKFRINRIRITPRVGGYGFPADFKLQSTTDGATWTDISGQSYTNYPNPGAVEQTFTLGSVLQVSGIRIYATKLGADNAGNYYLQLPELWFDVTSSNRIGIAYFVSSERTGYEPAKVRDGKSTTYWGSAEAAAAANIAWVSIDFGSVKSVNGAGIRPRSGGTGFPVDWKLQSSIDGSTWTDIAGQSYTNYTNPGSAEQRFSFAPVAARHLRVYASKLGSVGAGAYALQLAELEAFTNGYEGRLSGSASSFVSGKEESKLRDGDRNSYYSSQGHAGSAATEWVSLDLGSSKRLHTVRIVPRNGGIGFPADFKLQSSTDGSAWTDIPGQQYTGYAAPGRQEQLFEFPSVQARYVRLYATKLSADTDGSYYLQLAEWDAAADGPMYATRNGGYDNLLDNMWHAFGAVDDGTDAVYKFGNESTFFDWIAKKLLWSDSVEDKTELKRLIREYPISDNGYLWSWGTQSKWPVGPGSFHYDGLPKYILAAYQIAMWDDPNFLNETDSSTLQAFDGTVDVSAGMTVKQKMEAAMGFMLNRMGGSSGLVITPGDLNTGLPGGDPTNYWDVMPFGYKDAYTNAYYVAALKAMSDMYDMLGDTTNGNYYATLGSTAEGQYNTAFWDGTKKRYAGTVDKNGTARDYGFTFVNTEALMSGAANATKANDIYDWLDGKRTVSGDTSTGGDIYSVTRFAPRANTLKIESVTPYWWYDPTNSFPVTGTCSFEECQQNGNAIFYVSYYDLMGRFNYRGSDNAMHRMNAIISEFALDELRRDPVNSYGHDFKMGVINEFPESGLVPVSFVYGLLGMSASSHGLELSPQLPSGVDRAGASNVVYRGRTYEITAMTDFVRIETLSGGAGTLAGRIGRLAPNASYRITNKNLSNGTMSLSTVTTDSNGVLSYSQTVGTAIQLTFEKI